MFIGGTTLKISDIVIPQICPGQVFLVKDTALGPTRLWRISLCSQLIKITSLQTVQSKAVLSSKACETRPQTCIKTYFRYGLENYDCYEDSGAKLSGSHLTYLIAILI